MEKKLANSSWLKKTLNKPRQLSKIVYFSATFFSPHGTTIR
jgi:hypothetical protein